MVTPIVIVLLPVNKPLYLKGGRGLSHAKPVPKTCVLVCLVVVCMPCACVFAVVCNGVGTCVCTC